MLLGILSPNRSWVLKAAWAGSWRAHRVARAVFMTQERGELVSANLGRLVLGCIEVYDFLKPITRVSALLEIYKVYILSHRSSFKIFSLSALRFCG